jgi:hypothetical protein
MSVSRGQQAATRRRSIAKLIQKNRPAAIRY